MGETSGGCLTQMAKEASGYTSLTLKASAAQSKNTHGCLLLPSPSALESGLLPGTSDLKSASQALAALKFPNGDVSRCLSFSFATSLVAAPFKVCPMNTKPGSVTNGVQLSGLLLPHGSLLLIAILTLVSVFTPGNAGGELVTPHWVLDGKTWLKVTLKEQVTIPYPVLIRGPGSQPLSSPPNAVSVFLGFSEPNHCTIEPLPVGWVGQGDI